MHEHRSTELTWFSHCDHHISSTSIENHPRFFDAVLSPSQSAQGNDNAAEGWGGGRGGDSEQNNPIHENENENEIIFTVYKCNYSYSQPKKFG